MICKFKASKPTKADSFAQRLEVLSVETARLEQNARERTRNLTTKASFLALAAGVLITATVTPSWTVGHWSLVTPLLFSVVALTLAAIAMKPDRINEVSASDLIRDHLEADFSAAEVQRRIMMIHASLIDDREKSHGNTAKLILGGYVALGAAGLSLVAFFLNEIMLRGGL